MAHADSRSICTVSAANVIMPVPSAVLISVTPYITPVSSIVIAEF